jgi:uncharacterized protein (UPF0303 family)
MTLIFQIAVGIVVGIILLVAIYIFIAVLIGHIEDNRDWKARQRAFSERFERAEKCGFVYDHNSVTPLEDQLRQWERHYASQAQAKAG